MKAPLFLASLAWLAMPPGCNGSFRFDQNSSDAGAAADVARTVDVATDVTADPCPDVTCGWQMPACDADRCPWLCHKSVTCVGSCGAACAGHCEEDSQCTLATGDSGFLVCERGATCEVSLGRAGIVDCEAGATCNVRCLADCTLRCQDGALCQLQCGSSAARIVVGSATCG